MALKLLITLGISTLLLTSCTHLVTKQLMPPRDAQWITIKGKLPPHTKPSIYTDYTTNICSYKTINLNHGARGKEYYHNTQYTEEINLNPETREYHIRIPVDGGTYCKWLLRSINIGFKYLDTSHISPYKEGVSQNGIKVYIHQVLDDGKPSRVASFAKYYILKYRKHTNEKTFRNIEFIDIKPTSKNAQSYISSISLFLRENQHGEIIFSPAIDENYIVKQIIDRRGEKKLYMEYPDGTIDKDTLDLRPYPKEKREKALAEQKRLLNALGIEPRKW